MTDSAPTGPPGSEYSQALQRNLGLYAVFSISIGAMIGSGIFVLPGLAFNITGPSVILAFFLAGIVVLPAGISTAEMATAMPEAGGTYLYIDRAMGPLMGTIAGFGVWFSLVFKAAFALVGLGAYLAFLVDVPARPIAFFLALLLIALNLIGVKETASFQAVLVTVVLLVLAGFVVLGLPEVEESSYEPFLSHGVKGLLAATGMVFVSYIGVTQVASVAEEVRRPSRNIPISILTSIALGMIIYPAVVAVIVGVTPPDELAATATPVATAADQFLGTTGVVVIAITAVAALVSMANAGIIASARYPFAMSRNALAPGFLQRIGGRSGAPVTAIGVTGAAIVALVVFVPLIELAKLASAFQLLIFALANLALIGFREARLSWYQPTFRSPLYPGVQIFGIVAAIVLLTQMGLVPTIGATLIAVAGALWYRVFGQTRAIKESAARDALRARADDRLVAATRDRVARPAGRNHILVAFRRPTRAARERTLMRIAFELARAPGGKVHVMHFDDPEPDQAPTEDQISYAEELGITITSERPGDVSRRGAVHAYVEHSNLEEDPVDLFLADLPQELRATRHVTRDARWLRDHLTCDSVFLRNRAVADIETIVVMGTGGPYDPVKIGLAHSIAEAEGASLRFVHVESEDATEAQMAGIAEYHTRLGETLRVGWDDRIEPADDLVDSLTRLSRGANLVVLGAPSHRFHLVTDLADRIAESVDCPALLVHTPTEENTPWWERLIQRFIS